MLSALTVIYFKLAELISTLVPFLDGMLNQSGVKILYLSDATDPGVIIKLFFDIIISLIAFFIIALISHTIQAIHGTDWPASTSTLF